MSAGFPQELPDRIRQKLEGLQQDVDDIWAKAKLKFKTEIPRRIAFDYTSSAPGDIIRPYQRAQSVSFVTRYEHLPEDVKIYLGKSQDEQWTISNFWVLRHVLNDYRPIIQNQNDSVFYTRLHSSWYPALIRKNPAEGLVVRALDEHGKDFTPDFAKYLTENKEAITVVLDQLEFGYLYNGILQHSDEGFSKRYLDDYTSGELNYIMWKHLRVLGFIKSLLEPYYRLMVNLTFPSLGPL